MVKSKSSKKAGKKIEQGIKNSEVVVGAPDPIKGRIAKKVATTSGGTFKREAGMMIDTLTVPQHSSFLGTKVQTYRTSYANGLNPGMGSYDIPKYFVTMNEMNGGIIYWPVTLREKYAFYRYFARTDAYISRGLSLLSDLPMSKFILNMPRMEDKKVLREEIKRFFEMQIEKIDLYHLCRSILYERNMIGNCFLFHEWDENMKMWSRVSMLPPEEVSIFEYPFSSDKRIEYRPEALVRMITSEGSSSIGTNEIENKILENVPEAIKEMVHAEGCILMDSDPMSGSFCQHIARDKSLYMDLGISILEGVYVPLLQREHYKYTQLSLATRNMTPKTLVTAPGILPDELDDLRLQIDQSYLDPDYAIVANFECNWQQIGTNDRLLDLSKEYESIENHIFAALGIPREIMTGEGMYSGSKISVEILNTMLMQEREVIRDYVEKRLFIPICEAHGWYEYDRNGIKTYFCPKIGFNRLTIRDNAEIFDSLFTLYQKGSINIEVIYELLNLNGDEISEKLREDLFTVKDPNFNELVRDINMEVGRALATDSDAAERIANYLGFKYTPPPPDGGMGMDGGDGSADGVDSGAEQDGADAAQGGSAQEEQPIEDGSGQQAEGQSGDSQQGQAPDYQMGMDELGSGIPQEEESPSLSDGQIDNIAQNIISEIKVNVSPEEAADIAAEALNKNL